MRFFFLLVLVIQLKAQNYSTFGGGNERSGRTKMISPDQIKNSIWTISNAKATTLGQAVYSFGDRLVNSRIIFSPYSGIVECRKIATGQLLWSSPNLGPSAIPYVIGFTKDAVYVNDYSNGDIYALNSIDGSIKWKSKITSYVFGAYPGCVFACNGDIILGGRPQDSRFTMRLNKNNGDLVWENKTLIAITPNAALACNNQRVYRITGGITIPIQLSAIDIETGKTLYHSDNLAGDPDQENPLTLGEHGEVYFWRDGGNLLAYKDVGTGFEKLWEFEPPTKNSTSLNGNISLGYDRSLYVFIADRILKLNAEDGSVMAESALLNFSLGSITIDGDSSVLINTGLGSFIKLSSDLQTVLWTKSVGSSNYCFPALHQEGIMILNGGGTSISAYQTVVQRSPVADFRANTYQTSVGVPINFFDQSSYTPDHWNWYFEGATIRQSSEQNPQNITYLTKGLYSVTLVVSNKHGMDSIVKTCFIDVLPQTSVMDYTYSKNVEIFPNPCVDRISVMIDPTLMGKMLKIYSMTGQLVFKQKLVLEKTEVDLSTLREGSYLMNIENQYHKFVKL